MPSSTSPPARAVAEQAAARASADPRLGDASRPDQPFESILYPDPRQPVDEDVSEPDFFHDLNLDQIIAGVTAAWKEYRLEPFFRTSLHDLASLRYRQDVMRELEDADTMAAVRSFSERMRAMRGQLEKSQKRYYELEKQAWFLAAVETYCEAIEQFRVDLESLRPAAAGVRALRNYVIAYASSDSFRALAEEEHAVRARLAATRYSLLIEGDSVTVRPYDDEPDYTAVVLRTFDKFSRGAVKDFRVKFVDSGGLNHVEARVLDRLALLNPEPFDALRSFCTSHETFQDPRAMRFDREVQFYIAYLDYVGRLRESGLAFCYPGLSETTKDVLGSRTFDLALAPHFAGTEATIVRNDFHLSGGERMFVVSGPNQGGKTTFARTFGQLHFLASLGCTVPGERAQLFLFDRLFSHFERSENIENLRGKLEDDLVRIHTILQQATPNSVIVMNEIFSSTTLEDAVLLSRKVLERVSELDLLAVFVTFLSELASFNEKTVSMVSTIDPHDPTVRTYKVERRPADGRAYALVLAEKYGLTGERIAARMRA